MQNGREDDNRISDRGSAGIADATSATLLKGATILAVAGIVSKVFGAIFRIPLTNMIGAEGQSYYGAAYPVYQLFYVIQMYSFYLQL